MASATPDRLRQAAGLHQTGRLAEAERLYRQILAAEPMSFPANHLLGILRAQQGRNGEALDLISRALRVRPDMPETLTNHGNVLRALGRPEEALASYDKALALRPDFIDVLDHRADILRQLGRRDEALAGLDAALARAPRHAGILYNRGNLLLEMKRFEEALASYDRALTLKPDFVEALNNRGSALRDLRRFEEALTSVEKVLALKPDFIDAHNNRAGILQYLARHEDALASYEEVLARRPDHPFAIGAAAAAALHLCDWKRTAALAGPLREQVVRDRGVVMPFVMLGCTSDPALQRGCAENYVRHLIPAQRPPLWDGTRYGHERIRLAYLSGDFYEHATAFLTAELFERHDRARFEIMGISYGPDDGSDTRARLVRAFDRFHDVRARTDREAADLLRAAEVDIAVDLKGHTRDARPEILSHRPCPVQVNYLGYPGTMGADFIDYVIADAIVLPVSQEPYFAEKIVRLPDCYQVNDSRRAIAQMTPSRRQAGLPEGSFVFCCFNASWKIAAPLFALWMRLLAGVSDSVLWLLQDSGDRNLRAEAAARGIDPRRIVFAPRTKPDDHLARHRLADLFLDTLPYNAHTTASDALWAGLPFITCAGEGFAGRVGASLLGAIGLPELVTHSLEEYEALALTLARDPVRRDALRGRLVRNRATHPLFDTGRFCRHIESAYARMREIAERGEAAHGFSVEPDEEGAGAIMPGPT